MSSDKIDRPMSKASNASLGKFRFHKDHGVNEAHVHDDDNGLKFTMETLTIPGARGDDMTISGIRRFEVAIENFINMQASCRDGHKVLIPGKPGKKGDKKACDLVFQRKANGWEAGLFLCGSVIADTVLGDALICNLDELVQRA